MLRRLSLSSSSSSLPFAESILARKLRGKRSKQRLLQERGEEEEDENLAWQKLPQGAEHIIRLIAAEMILQELLNKVNDRSNVDHEAIYNVVKEFPGVCHKSQDFVWEDGSKRFLPPLSIVCCLKPPLKLVKAVLEANPKAVRETEPCKKSLPLHLASAFEASLEVVQYIYEQFPEAISKPRSDGVLPLHLACGFFLGESSVVNFLLDKYPDGAKAVCSGIHWTPFHSATHGGVSDVRVLQRLCELEPRCISSVDKHGRTPLHLAARSQHGNAATCRFLVENHPDALQVEDNLDGWTPLFLASIYQQPETIKAIVDLMPANTRTTNVEGGANLLHWASIANPTSDSVEFLAERFPELLAQQTTDQLKDTPLSCAIVNEGPIENIMVLIARYPRALFIKNAIGNRPLISARCCKASKEVIRLLETSERKYKDLAPRKGFFW